MSSQITHYINGKRVAGTSSRTAAVFNPATGQQSATVDLASKADVRAAVESARAVAAEWANTTPLRRARILNKFLGILESRSEELAAAITAEHGKVLSDALGEVTRGIEVVEFATGAPQLLKGEFTENVGTKVDSHSVRQPLGIVAGITPFNFPAM
ncbi:MAG TPA: methylmalonate-semialdehyde dehydrogenase (CoA acylating), partial [Thalassospira sp.]|nr:methylmalonate-semialdehyde dehydrogenase (CoA acylating) [Thalassospira sp.]